MKRIFLIMGVLVLSIGLLAACGGGDDDDSGAEDVQTSVSDVATSADEEMTSTEAEETETEAEGTGTMAEGTGTEAEGTGTMAEGTGTSEESMGTGTSEEDMGTGTSEEGMGTGTEAEGAGTAGEGETYAIGDPIDVSDGLTVTVEGTTDSVDTSVATPEEGMTFLGVEVSVEMEGAMSGMTDLPSTFQSLALEDSAGETYDLNMEATTEMIQNAAGDIGGDATASGTASDDSAASVTLTLVFEVPEDVTPSDLTLTGETEDGEMFSVPLEESSGS